MKMFRTTGLLAAFAAFLALGDISPDGGFQLSPPSAQAKVKLNQYEYYGCTYRLHHFRRELQTKKYAAFAKGRAFTITGMMGCGMAWNEKSQAAADKVAIAKCRKVAKNPDKCYVSDRTK